MAEQIDSSAEKHEAAQASGGKAASGRLAFIDWTRGLGAVIMLQGHTFDSFTRTDLRKNSPFMLSQFFGGLPPAIFLFLTGITFAFLMHSQETKNASLQTRVMEALKRSRYLFLIAFLFRIQLYVFGYPTSPASELLRVDILNCMGMAMLIMAPMAVFTTAERVRLCAVLGILIAGLAPVISLIPTNGVPWLVNAYFFPSFAHFGFFPWASYLAFGLSMGSLLRLTKPEALPQLMLWTLSAGFGLIFSAQFFSNFPYSFYGNAQFWLNSPALTLIRLGVVLVILAVGFLWLRSGNLDRWSFFRQLGTTSLLVYWVHIEIVYGRWFGIWKEALSVGQVLLFTAVLLALMTALSIWRTRLDPVSAFFRSKPQAAPVK